MKKILFTILILIFGAVPSFAEEKLLIIYLYNKNSPYLKEIENKIIKNKYLAKRIQKNFNFKKIQIGTQQAEDFVKKFKIKEKEGVYFIDFSAGEVLYSLTDLSKPCRCANLINYFSRKLHKKNIDPDRYLYLAEKWGAYTRKVEKEYLF
ncbi:hypothetical protein [Persephonella sp. IF05-L8]|uniref:hypothetical protein n=1 Tax=Persephonella sp. IF05-L8 TaxID=1158338 RepID=UPI0004983571